MSSDPLNKWTQLSQSIKRWGTELGFQQVGITHVNLQKHKTALQNWLDKGYHGDMSYMAQNIEKRCAPAELVPGTIRVVSVRLDYLPQNAQFASNLKDSRRAYISRYATGRDYHKVIRNKLKKLGEKISAQEPTAMWRPFTDSAPVLEHTLAQNSGIGWTGKHSLTLNEHAGSWFFLGELFINLPLATDEPASNKCGQCVACIKICPTAAIVEPYVVDGRRCISYLTIENKQDIPVEFREAMGNRIYGCDDCQLICPWNRYASLSNEVDFEVRHNLNQATLLELFQWDEDTFLSRMQGSAIRRIGYQCWQRNIAVALGNAIFDQKILNALEHKISSASDMVARHIQWAITQQNKKRQLSQEKILITNAVSKKSEASETRQTLRLIRSIEKGLPRDA